MGNASQAPFGKEDIFETDGLFRGRTPAHGAEPRTTRRRENKVMRKKAADNYYATGRRKNAIARVWLKPGTGEITINAKPMAAYLGRKVLEMVVESPLKQVGLAGKVDIVADTEGGGIAGQAGAIKLGIARAVIEMDPNLRTPLRRTGFLTRDPRVKERKKYGRKRARRGFQFVKR